MTVVLDAKAFYVEGEASQPTILTEVFIFDQDEDTYKPNLVKSGTVTLIQAGTDTHVIEFDKRFGTADGSIYFQFSNPSSLLNLQIRINVDLVLETGNPLVLARTIPVLREDERPLPLSSQSDTGKDVNDELRSKKRVEEGI